MAHRFLPFRLIGARPRLFSCVLLGIVAYGVMPNEWRWASRSLIAWNVGMVTYLLLVSWMMWHSTARSICIRAQVEDEGRFLILILSTIAAIASIGAIVAQLASVKDASGLGKAMHLGLSISTILTSWLFIHVMYALHYAHEFYFEFKSHPDLPAQSRGGLVFPDDVTPGYSDFLYFAFAIGCAGATSDVNVSSKPMRSIDMAHSILAFFFNATILALTINIAAGLI